jgi:hypothetical protein
MQSIFATSRLVNSRRCEACRGLFGARALGDLSVCHRNSAALDALAFFVLLETHFLGHY